MVDDTKIASNSPEGQAETPNPRAVQIEKALLWRELKRIASAVEAPMADIVKAFPKHRINQNTLEAIGKKMGERIARAIDRGGMHEGWSLDASEILDLLPDSDRDALISDLVATFLKRVDEIGEIAEDAQARAGGC